MDVAATEQDLPRWNADDLAPREAVAEDLGRALVVSLVDQRVDDTVVAEIQRIQADGGPVASRAAIGRANSSSAHSATSTLYHRAFTHNARAADA